MREIKFRVWCEDKNEWEKEKTYLTPCGKLFRKYVLDGVYRDDSHNHVVEQYTGLKDKNGVDIYEGDIMIVDNYMRGTVEWSEQRGRWCIFTSFELNHEHIKQNKMYQSSEFRLDKGTANRYTLVIGNIHEV